MGRSIVELIVFVVGFCIMSLEIVSSRVLAPYIGTSIISWTSIIGMILFSLSLGYFLGGKYADRGATKAKLAYILIISAIYLFVFSLFNTDTLSFVSKKIPDLRILSLVSTGLFLFVPNLLLGAVSPYCVRLKLKDINKSGRLTGNLYAISTGGSIVGTFLTGFYFISFLGILKILITISILLVISAFLLILDSKSMRAKVFILLLLALFLTTLFKGEGKHLGIYDVSSFYNRIIVEKRIFADRPILALNTSRINYKDGFQGGIFTDGGGGFVAKYNNYYYLAEYFNPGLKNALAIGGGAYAFPMDFLKRNKNASLDVVEEDAKITDVARSFFGLKDNPRLTIYNQEGRYFIENNRKKYDAIFLDIYQSDSTVSFQTSTVEFVQKLRSSLSDNGIVIMNIASSILGRNGKFLRAEYWTYKNVFNDVYIFPVTKPNDYYHTQNVILIAFKSEVKKSLNDDNAWEVELLKTRYTSEIPRDTPILTDNFAPVESYLVERMRY